ncbi:MAG: YecA family protein [Rhodanobacteraceae bacterium]|nr:MAG: YecA family protein [Rhodanobacteraceae bacterium]
METPVTRDIIDDAELEVLDHWLRGHAADADATLLLDGVHGMLTALAIGPDPALPAEWLPEVLHAPFENPEQGATVLALLAKLNDSIPAELEGETYEPVLGEVDRAVVAPEQNAHNELTAAGWCEGFSRGIDLRASIWESRLAEDAELMEMLSPIMALAVDDGVLAADVPIAKLDDDEYEGCLAQIPDAVEAVAHYWRVRPPTERERTAGGGASSSAFASLPARRGGRWVH